MGGRVRQSFLFHFGSTYISFLVAFVPSNIMVVQVLLNITLRHNERKYEKSEETVNTISMSFKSVASPSAFREVFFSD